MRDCSLLFLLLLILGGFVLVEHAKLPHWLFYAVVLAVLAGTRRLEPHLFAHRWFDTFWRVCVGLAALGLMLEAGSQLAW